MHITVHPMIAAQRAVLDLPQAERREAILRLLEPFEPMVRIMLPPGVDPIHMFGLMRPDGPEQAYRQALDRLEAAGAEEVCRLALERAAAAIAATGYPIPIDTLHFGLFLWDADPAKAALNQGYTGFGGIPGYVMVNIWPDDRNLPRLGRPTTSPTAACTRPARAHASAGRGATVLRNTSRGSGRLPTQSGLSRKSTPRPACGFFLTLTLPRPGSVPNHIAHSQPRAPARSPNHIADRRLYPPRPGACQRRAGRNCAEEYLPG